MISVGEIICFVFYFVKASNTISFQMMTILFLIKDYTKLCNDIYWWYNRNHYILYIKWIQITKIKNWFKWKKKTFWEKQKPCQIKQMSKQKKITLNIQKEIRIQFWW